MKRSFLAREGTGPCGTMPHSRGQEDTITWRIKFLHSHTGATKKNELQTYTTILQQENWWFKTKQWQCGCLPWRRSWRLHPSPRPKTTTLPCLHFRPWATRFALKDTSWYVNIYIYSQRVVMSWPVRIDDFILTYTYTISRDRTFTALFAVPCWTTRPFEPYRPTVPWNIPCIALLMVRTGMFVHWVKHARYQESRAVSSFTFILMFTVPRCVNSAFEILLPTSSQNDNDNDDYVRAWRLDPPSQQAVIA